MADITYTDTLEDGSHVSRSEKDAGAAGYVQRVWLEGGAAAATGGTLATFVTGAKSAIGTSAVQLTATSTPATKGVTVKAASGNTAKVFVGASTVTAGSADATDGVELGPNESVTIEVDNANKIYNISTAAGQKVYFVAV